MFRFDDLPRRARAAGLAIILAVIAAAPAAAGVPPRILGVTPVTGAPDLFFPRAEIANLDAGNLVAGASRWDNDGDGIVFNKTYVGFLWSAAAGADVFRIDDTLYSIPNIHFPRGIADNATVVGQDLFPDDFKVFPFLWTSVDGFRFLPLPCPGAPLTSPGGVSRAQCTGSAAAISRDGSTAVGIVRRGLFAPAPAMAASWTITRLGGRSRFVLEALDTPDPWSDALAVSADGSVIVGDSGPDGSQLSAARWVDGVPSPMEAVGAASVALFVSDAGDAAIGSAEIGGTRVLVRWDGSGAATIATPPAGRTIETIRAANAAATVAVGALSAGGNWAPYVWTSAGGFTVLPENGLEQDYDRSEALAVSADGTRVVGALQSSVQSDLSPKPAGFLWDSAAGLAPIDDIFVASGLSPQGVFQASAISSDGRRLLVTGDPARTDHDTTSLLLDVSAP